MKNSTLSPELENLLETSRPVQELDLDGLAKSIRDLEKDPIEVAESRKAAFVEDTLRALDESKITQSELARRLGKTRQQLSAMLNENRLNNFTIDTMAQISTALGRKLHVRMFKSEVDIEVKRFTTTQVIASRKQRIITKGNWNPVRGLESDIYKSAEQALARSQAPEFGLNAA